MLGTLHFLFPVRTVGRAEERIAALLVERRVALQDEERRRSPRSSTTARGIHLIVRAAEVQDDPRPVRPAGEEP